MKRVLVTGGAGFLGLTLARRLRERGYAVRIFGRRGQPQLEKEGFEVCCGDLGEPEAVRGVCAGVEAVFHVAAKAGVWGAWRDYYRTNVLGTRHVVEACRAEGVGRLVYTSTPSVVFNREAFRGADERLPYGRGWLCHYARSKALAEAEVLAAHDPKGLRVTALRPHLIWGPGDPHIAPRLIESARKGRLAIVGRGDNRVDITHVNNAAEAHLLALNALEGGDAGGRAYFISDGEPVVLWEWINALLRHLGVPPVQRRVSLPKAYALGALMEMFYRMLPLKGEPPMTRFVAVELAKDHYFDISAGRRDLGYAPVVYPVASLEGAEIS